MKTPKAIHNLNKTNELTFMMCEKITHLTKVVFLLNAKQGESEAMIESIINSYEKELWTMVKEANAAMTTLKNIIKKTSQEDLIKKNLQQIEDKYIQSLASFTLIYDKFKTEVDKREKVLIEETQKKIDEMKNEVIEIRSNTETIIKEYAEKDKEKTKLNETKIDELQKEINELLKNKKLNISAIEESNIQYAKLQNDSNQKIKEKDNLLLIKEKTIKELNNEISICKSQIKNHESNLVIYLNQINTAQKEIKSLKKNESLLKEKIKQSEMIAQENQAKTDEKIKLEQKNNELVINDLKEQIEKKNKQVKDNEQIINQNKEKIEILTKLENENKTLTYENTKAKETIEKLNQSLVLIQGKTNENDSKYNKVIQDNQLLNQKLLAITQELSEVNKRASILKENELSSKTQLDKIRTELNQEKALKTTYENEISNLNKKLNENKNKHEEQRVIEQTKTNSIIANLNTSINQLNLKMKGLEDQIKIKNEECDKKEKDVKESCMKEIEQIKTKNKIQLEEETKKIQINASVALNQTNQQLKTLKASYAEEKLSLESKHREEIDRITFQSTLKLNEVQLNLDSQISNLKIENIQLKEKIEDYAKLTCDTSNSFKKNNTLAPISQRIPDIDTLISNLRKDIAATSQHFSSESGANKNNLQLYLEALVSLQERNTGLSNEINELRIMIKNKPTNEKDMQEIHQLKAILFKKEKLTQSTIANEMKEREIETSIILERNNSFFKKVNDTNQTNNTNNTNNKHSSMKNANKTQKLLNGVKQFKLKAINCRSSIK